MTDLLAKRLRLPNGTFLPNRIAKAAMSERVAHRSGAPSEGHVRLYEQWGEGVAAAVVLRDGCRAEVGELQAWVRERLRSSRTPERIEFWVELPYNETGKLLRRVIKEWF